MTTTSQVGRRSSDRGPAPLEQPPLAQALAAALAGEVRFDLGSRGTYASDSSNYRQVPLGVVAPRSIDDAVRAIAICRDHHAPVLSRGGGTSLAGQCTNEAVVLEWTKYCNRIVSVDAEARACVVEPGIALDDLNAQLSDRGLMFGPKPATHRTCTIGGMIGNNSCGSTAQAYGKTVDNVVRLEVLTYDGLRMWVGPTSDAEYEEILAEGGRRAEIYCGLRELRDQHLAELRIRFPHIPRRVSGYPPDRLGDYLRDFRDLLSEFGYDLDETSLYGHFGQGCIHTSIPFELRTGDGVAQFRAFVERAADLVVAYGGSLSGEHGDGQARGELLVRMFGDRVVGLFGLVKELFDPDQRMNPGKVVRAAPLDRNLRLGPSYAHDEPVTFFSYPDDHGRFSSAALRCAGIGKPGHGLVWRAEVAEPFRTM